jgi:hypothetical protein
VQVDVEDLLERGLSVSEEHVDAFAGQARAAQRRGQPLRHDEHVAAQCRVQVRQVGRVRPGDHQQVASVQRPDVQERDHALVGIHDAGRAAPANDVAEDAPGLAARRCHAGILPDPGPVSETPGHHR